VPRRREASHGELADADDIAVGMRLVRIRQGSILPGVDPDRPKLRESAGAGDVVVVDVRLERVGDQHAEARGRSEIRIDVPVGVDQKRDAGVGVRDEIARVPEAGVEELLDQQLARTLRASALYGRGGCRTAFDSCASTSSPGPGSPSCGAITGGMRSSTLLLFVSASSSESSGRGLSLSMTAGAASAVPSATTR
jgi:hypothetical protein